MAKIILTDGATILQEMPLLKERVTIGRRPHNDIVIYDSAISGDHAVIVTFFNDSILEDLNSTNGTHVNGQPVMKHFLQHDDVIELGQHQLRYVAEVRQKEERAAGAFREQNSQPASCTQSSLPTCERHRAAIIKILEGPNAGKLVVLAKALTTIGASGSQIAAIVAGADGYSIFHVEGMNCPIINGNPIGKRAWPLQHGDMIEVSGTRIAFALS